MFKWKTHTKKFDTDDASDMVKYSEVINNPLCTVISHHRDKVSDRYLTKGDDGDGDTTHIHEHIVLVVTWKEKVLF